MLLLSILVFISLRKFLIKTWSMTLSWNFSPSTMTIIWRFISHISCKFLSCFLFFHILHLFGLDLLLSLSPHIISSAQFIVLVRLFIKISNCDTEFFLIPSSFQLVFSSMFLSLYWFCFQIFNYLHHFIQVRVRIYIILDITQVFIVNFLEFNKVFVNASSQVLLILWWYLWLSF